MKLLKYPIIFLFVLFSCSTETPYRDVGDIPFDSETDDVNFELCNESNIKQYYVRRSSDTAPKYKNEKRGLEKAILSQYSYNVNEKENGYITIRFIVNCKGQSDRFRVEEMDFNYQPIDFDNSIIDQLLKIVRSLNGWTPRKRGDRSYDFYQYITFRIENGQIVKILP